MCKILPTPMFFVEVYVQVHAFCFRNGKEPMGWDMVSFSNLVTKVTIISKAIQPNLATYTNMEIGKIFLYFWLHTKTNNKNMVIGTMFFQNLANLSHFFHGKSFMQVEIILFKQGFGKNSLVKETLDWNISKMQVWTRPKSLSR